METQQRSRSTRFSDPMDNLQPGEMREAGVATGNALQTFEPVPAMQSPFAEAILARAADKPRNIAKIKQALHTEAAAWGNKWMYGWDVRSGNEGKKQRVEGGTIKMANAIARLFGNCIVETRVFEEGTAWMFYARFVDLETGYTLVRAYRQRKGADIGMKDAQRAMDIVFAIGQSKAIRNVVLNALPDLEDFCKEEAKNATLVEIQADPDKCRKWILKKIEELAVDRRRVEALYGRTAENWTVPDMAKIVAEVESVVDGMLNAVDVWPAEGDTSQTAEEVKQGANNPAAKKPAAKAPQPTKAHGGEGVSLQFTLEDGTRLPHDRKGDVPPPGTPIELDGKLHHVVSVDPHDDGSVSVVVKPHKVIQPQKAPQEPSTGPAAAAGSVAPGGPAVAAAPAKRNLFGPKKGG